MSNIVTARALRAIAPVSLAVLALAIAGPSFAQASPSAADQETRIARLEAELNALKAELDAVKREAHGQAPVQTASTTPSAVSNPAQALNAPAPSPGTATQPNPGAPSAALAQAPAIDGEFAPNTPTSAASATIIGGHPTIQSGNGAFTANLLGVMQFDASAYDQANAGPLATDLRRGAAATDTAHARDLSNGTNFRRARIGIGGKVFQDFEYNILYDFGGAGEEDAGHVQELWVQYSALRPLHIRVGAFAPSMGLEDTGSTSGSLLLERPAITDIARSLAGGEFREALQFTVNTNRWFGSLAVSGRTVGVVNSTASGVSQPFDDQLGYVARLATVALSGKDYLLHLGVHGSYVQTPADVGGPDAAANAVRYPLELRERPELRVDGTRLIDTGAIDSRHGFTTGAEVAGAWRNLFLQAEVERIGFDRRNPLAGQTDPRFSGWYVEGGWMLTGEARKYNTGNFAFDGPTMRRNFSLKDGGWGAWELAFRYSDTDLNYHQGAPGAAPSPDAVRGGEQTIFSAGLNWYLNPVVRLMADYQHVEIDRLSPNATTFQTPPGAQIGQTYQVFTLRSQLAF